jgi:hypothetical protein
LAEIYRESGLYAGYELPRYTMDGGEHADASQVLSWLEAHPNFRRVEAADPAFGDLVTFRLARVAQPVATIEARLEDEEDDILKQMHTLHDQLTPWQRGD